MRFRWSREKDVWLQKTRGVSFDELLTGELVAFVDHPNQVKYPHQKVMYVRYRQYIYVMPVLLEGSDTVFVKTAYPSRKARKLFIP